MAHWNPYYSGPNQNNTFYENQNQQFYNTLPYGIAYQQYDGYYMQNATNLMPNAPATIRTAREIEAEQLLRSQHQNIVKSNVQNETPSPTVLTSNLTATAAEFKPSSSNQAPIPIKTQTFSNNNYKNENSKPRNFEKEKSNQTKENESGPSKTNESTQNYPKNKGNFMKFNNKNPRNDRSYSRGDSERNYSNDRYARPKDRERDRFKSNGGSKDDERPEHSRTEHVRPETNNIAKTSNGSGRFPNYQRDYYYSSKNNRYNKNAENNYSRDSRNSYEYNERYSSDNPYQSDKNHPSDKFKNSKSNNYRDRNNYREREENKYEKNNYREDNKYEKNNYREEKYEKNNYREESKYENWRSNIPSANKGRNNDYKKSNKDDRYSLKSKKERSPTKEKLNENEIDDVSQRDRLIEQVNRGTLECLVCCEYVRQVDKTWACQKCYHVFHLRCSLKWAKASKDDNGWRCPACQHVCSELPSDYVCYCGKTPEPVYRQGDTAHSCGSICGRLGVKPGCPHRCRLLCHPGPCPTCEDLISKSCNCGKTKQMVKCSANIPLVCQAVCDKPLNCGVHFCKKNCHPNDCDICTETIDQECYCGKENRSLPCTNDQVGIKYYSCEGVCNTLLKCGNHKCQEICHQGDCAVCVQAVEQVKTCPCGKSELTTKRESCLDPIPCCDKICGKQFTCGPPGNRHTCQGVCHEGACPPCLLTSHVLCRCGHMSKEIECKKLVSRTDDARCEKRCTKKRSCAKHKCNQNCCIDVDHICPLPCNRMLPCGQHRCEQTCHKGRCQACWRTSFEELYCECGSAVIYPPVPCGTKRPACNRPCTREHGCEHEALHTCHSQPECPPCTVLTTKWCYGNHEKRTTIPCHQKEFSCGLPCGRDLPCGRHKCQTPCHKGPCIKEGQNCTQTCNVAREQCGHPCGLLCHDPPCPESACKETVKVQCECGLQSSTRPCVDMVGEYQKIANSMLASKMADMQLGHTIEIGDVLQTTRKRILRTLDCNDECRLIERNRRLAIGLQIRNPDLSAKLTPRYSDFMKQWAKKDPKFCQVIHDKLTELVQLAKQSKQKSRSYSFDSMNRDKRHFIHEYCEHFGCESAAYDQEPNRNVVATAVKDKAWLPSMSVLGLLQREAGQRKVPGPILNRPLSVKPSTSQSVSLKINAPSTSRGTFSSTLQRPKTPEGEMIDYFDYNPTKNSK